MLGCLCAKIAKKLLKRATESYSLGLYYQASELLYDIWQQEKQQYNSGDPEVPIYLQNCLIERNKRQLKQDEVEIYTIDVVVPIYYNNGAVARQLLRGVAQLQLQVNLVGLRSLNDIAKLRHIIEIKDFLGTIIATKMCLRVLIVNEDKQVSQTAENLAAVAEELNIIAAIGHDSSEMTQKAVIIYARKGLVLITPSSACDTLSNLIEHIRKQEVNILVIVPDEGIEKTLYNAELISAANINDCLIVGSATFAYQNILDWLDVNISSGLLNRNNLSNFLFVVPWHWRSQSNGFNSNNSLAVNFCKLAERVWGEDRVTWQSATAYDSVLIVIKILERNAKQNCHTLFENMHQFYKDESKNIQGITGTIQFDKNGDRINPPTEILTVQWSDGGHCEFIPIEN